MSFEASVSKIKAKIRAHTTLAPGMSVWITARGKESTHNFGIQSIETGVPIDDHSMWNLRGVSTNISATVIAWLASHGVTNFDTKINSILDVPFANQSVSDSVTIRHALSQTTGLPGGSGNVAAMVGYRRPFIYKTIRAYALIGFNELYQHAQLGTTLGFETAVRQAGYRGLIPPLMEFAAMAGMKHISIGKVIPDRLLVYPNVIVNERFVQGEPVFVSPFVPANDIYGTIGDVAAFVRLHLKRGAGIVRSKALKQLYQPVVKPDLIIDGDEYGMGTMITYFNVKGRKLTVLGHGGSYSEGYMHKVLYDVDNGIGVAVLTNV